MKYLFLFLFTSLFSTTLFAQHMDNYSGPMDIQSLVQNLPTFDEAMTDLSNNNGSFEIKHASQDDDRDTDAQKRSRPNWDYGYVVGNCAMIAHAYQHTVLGVPYGPIYYIPEVVGCI